MSRLPHRYRDDPKPFTDQHAFILRESSNLLIAEKRIGNYASAEMSGVHSYGPCTATCSRGATTTTGPYTATCSRGVKYNSWSLLCHMQPWIQLPLVLVLPLAAVEPGTKNRSLYCLLQPRSQLPLVFALPLAAVEPGTLQEPDITKDTTLLA